MNLRIIVCLIFLSTLPVLSFSQQTAHSANRLEEPILKFEAERGEVENFKTLAYRFELAWQESDFKSMADLRNGLLVLMGNEAAQHQTAVEPSKSTQERLKKMTSHIENIKKVPLSNSTDMGTKAEAINQIFNDFIKLMEEDLSERGKALRSID